MSKRYAALGAWSADKWMPALALLLTLLLLFLLIAGWLWVKRTPQPVPVVPAIDFVEPEVRVDSGLDNGLFDSIQERPLFWSERRPYVPPVEVEEEEEEPPPVRRGPDPFDDVKLVGVYSSSTGSGVIISVNGERQRLARYDSTLGWMLMEADATGALFVRDGEEMDDESHHRRLSLEQVF